jgi:PhnB protein
MKRAKKPSRTAATKQAAATKKAAAPNAAARAKRVAAIPPGYGTVTPHLVCREAAKAIDFYKKAFGAKERLRMAGPGGSIAHAEIQIGGSIVMLGDETPEMGASAPPSLGGTPVGLFIYSENVDKAYAKAISAGATSEQPPTDMFWGDRYCKLVDPFGHKWSIATHIEDVSPREMTKRMAAAFAQPQA